MMRRTIDRQLAKHRLIQAYSILATLLLAGCGTAPSNGLASAQAQQPTVYCNAVEMRGTLAENIALLPTKPACSTYGANEQTYATKLDVNGQIDSNAASRLGVAFDLYLTAITWKRAAYPGDIEPQGANVGESAGSERLDVGKEKRFSTAETHVTSIRKITVVLTDLTSVTVCVSALRTPVNRKPLQVVICRNVAWAFDAQIENEVQAIIRNDMPLIAAKD
jgi:hypothetical protein